jgi:hypothetical protein
MALKLEFPSCLLAVGQGIFWSVTVGIGRSGMCHSEEPLGL